MKKSKFEQALQDTILVCDGAMGTMIYARGVYINRCFDELNLTDRELIGKIHHNYINAGAEVIETNTFGANRIKLARHALADRISDIIAAGVEVAREAAESRPGVFVAGSVGPLGAGPKARKELTEKDAEAAFAEQIGLLIENGTDLILLETFTDPEELVLALKTARSLSGDVPVVAQAVFNERGKSPRGGKTVEEVTRMLLAHQPTAVGMNCRLSADQMLPLLARMREVTDLPITCQPNVGTARVVEDRDMYLSTPEFMAEYFKRAIQGGGLKMVGGCCGSTPEHIRAVSATVRMLRPSRVVVGQARELVPVDERNEIELVPWGEKTPFAAKMAAGKFVSSVEIRSPRGTDDRKPKAAAARLAAAGVDAMNIPDGPRASARMSPLALGSVVKPGADIEIIVHYTCRDRNLLGIQADLLGAHCLGIRNILAVTGDPPKLGDYPDASAVYDVDSIGLVSIINRLNRGEDMAGNPIGAGTAYLIGVGANPGAINPEEEVRRLWAKIDSGAEYVFTQPVYEMEYFHRFLDRAGKLPVPLLVGLLPLYSYRNAEFLHNEVPGMTVPESIRKRMRDAGSGAAAQDEGVAIAREALESVKDRVQGAYIMPPFDKYEMALRVLDGFIES
jgi:methionine synthase / methylenetetrahydrofolate reductase (NADH)